MVCVILFYFLEGRIYSTSSRNVFDVDDEDKEYAEREKKFTLRRKLFRESLKVKNLERANGFTRKNLDASDDVRDESVRRRRDDGRRGNGAARVEVVRAVRRRYGRESETGFDVVVDEKGNGEEDGFPETAEEKLQRIIFERAFAMEKYAEWWPEAVLKAVRKGGPGYAKRMAGRRMEIAESIAEFAFSREYDERDDSSSGENSGSSSGRIRGATNVLKRADVAAIAGLLSLGETLVTVDFSRDREMTKKKLRESIKAFVDARRQAQTVKDYAKAWTVVDAIVTNGANSLDRLVDLASSKSRDDSKNPSPRDALRMASSLFEKKQEFVSGLFKGKHAKKKDNDDDK